MMSRAVRRGMQAGFDPIPECPHCGRLVQYATPLMKRFKEEGNMQVVCNVYHRGKWQRTVHYHEKCWHEAGGPHGPLIVGQEEPRSSDGRHETAVGAWSARNITKP